MDNHQNHGELLDGLHEQLLPVLEGSKQGIYVYFDDEHKFCNAAFADLLGYGSEDEWAAMEGSFPAVFVDAGSQHDLVAAYRDAMEKMAGSTANITWKKKDGSTVASKVMLVPISFEGHLFALHFVAA